MYDRKPIVINIVNEVVNLKYYSLYCFKDLKQDREMEFFSNTIEKIWFQSAKAYDYSTYLLDQIHLQYDNQNQNKIENYIREIGYCLNSILNEIHILQNNFDQPEKLHTYITSIFGSFQRLDSYINEINEINELEFNLTNSWKEPWK